jgi:hypothetical protein
MGDRIFRLNMYTAPAYFMGFVVLTTIVLILLFFRDRAKIQTSKDPKRKSTKRAAIDDHANQMTFVGLTVYDCCILGCMLLNVSTKGSIGSFETLGINIAEMQFSMTSARAGTIVASCGTVGVAALLSMGYLATFFNDIQLICGGMVIMCCGILSLAFLEDNSSNPSWKFILAIFLVYSIGYPIGHTAVIGLFSKSEFCFCISTSFVFLPSDGNHFVFHSCWTKTSGHSLGLVCVRWVLCKTYFSHHVWLCGQLCRYFRAMLCSNLRVGSLDCHYIAQSNDAGHFVSMMAGVPNVESDI